MTDDLHTDGNDVASLLDEALGGELTNAVRHCRTCGGDHLLATHRAYHGAATVLRCPACDDVALRIARFGEELVFEWRGTFRATRYAAAP
jgi:hypothetical protein